MKYFFTLFLSCFLSSLVFAQNPVGSVSGHVYTASGEAAEFVHVKVLTTPAGAITSKNGSYQIESLKPGTYTLHFSYISMEPVEKQVVVLAGESTQVPDVILHETLDQLQEVVISGTSAETYQVAAPSTSLRLQGPLLEIPQNIQVIPQQVIQDQQALEMLEAVSRNVSGVQMIEHWGNFARINMRGFKIPAFRNGMNVEMPWGPLSEDMSIVERVEFVKGPAGFMLSSGEPGGLYNVVTKKPDASQLKEVSFTLGSFNTLRSTLDLGGSLNENNKLLYRVNLMALTKGAHRDYEFNKRFTVAPSLRYQLSDKTSVTAEYIYQYSQMSVVGAAYVFSPKGFADLPRNFTLAEPAIDPTDIQEHNIFLGFHHQLTSAWSVHAQLGYLHYKQVGSSLWPASVAANGDMIRELSIWDALNESKMGQVYTKGKVITGPVTHQVLAGADMGHKDYLADWFQTIALDTEESPFNIYTPTYTLSAATLPKFDRSRSIRSRAYGPYAASVGQRYASLYVQDELGFFKNKVRLTLAGRYTSYKGWSYGVSSNDEVVTPRVGLSVTVAKNTSLYGLFDQSFIPQTGVNPETNEPFIPERAGNIEFGLKRSWADGRWNSSLAVYQITKENVLVAHRNKQDYPFGQEQLGEVQSEGVELDVQGEIVDGLQLIFNYAYTNAEITKDPNPEGSSTVGNRIAGHARHMTNGWLKYNFRQKNLNGVGVALGYQYQADRSSWNWGANNDSLLPDYFRLDGALSWQNERFSADLTVNNLLNDYLYSGSAYGDFFYWQSEPGTNMRMSLAYKF